VVHYDHALFRTVMENITPQTLDTASGTLLMVAHAHTQRLIVLLEKSFFVYGTTTRKLCSEFNDNRFITYVTILHTDAWRTADEWTLKLAAFLCWKRSCLVVD